MLDVTNLMRREGEEIELNQEIQLENVELTYDKIFFKAPLKLKGVLKNVGEALILEAKLYAIFDINCYSCGKEFEYSEPIDIKERFLPLQNDEDYVIISDKIDLEKVILDNILLKLPTKFICNAECKGVCTICGINKNEKVCNCNNEQIDPRFEKLRQLLNK